MTVNVKIQELRERNTRLGSKLFEAVNIICCGSEEPEWLAKELDGWLEETHELLKKEGAIPKEVLDGY